MGFRPSGWPRVRGQCGSSLGSGSQGPIRGYTSYPFSMRSWASVRTVHRSSLIRIHLPWALQHPFSRRWSGGACRSTANSISGGPGTRRWRLCFRSVHGYSWMYQSRLVRPPWRTRSTLFEWDTDASPAFGALPRNLCPEIYWSWPTQMGESRCVLPVRSLPGNSRSWRGRFGLGFLLRAELYWGYARNQTRARTPKPIRQSDTKMMVDP